VTKQHAIPADDQPSTRSIGLLLAFIGVAAFSLTLPMTTIAVGTLDPLQVAVWRAILACITAAIIIFWDYLRLGGTQFIRPRGRQWGALGLCALGVVFGFPVFTTLAMSEVSASHGAVVVGLLPLGTAMAGVAVTSERPSLAFWVVAVVGTALTVAFVVRQSGGLGGGIGIGHLYLLAAVVAASVGYAIGGQLAKLLAGWRVACWSLLVASPLLLGLAFIIPPIPMSTAIVPLSAFLYLALISQLFGFFAWYRGMAYAGVARASQVQLLQLFMTVAAAIVLLGEPFDPEVLFFGAAVVVCVAIGTRIRIRGA